MLNFVRFIHDGVDGRNWPVPMACNMARGEAPSLKW